MQKTTKKLLGLFGLALVALLTIFAYFLPTNGVYAEGGSSVIGKDTLRVTVYSLAPSIVINDPENEYVTTSPLETITFTFGNAIYVDFTLTYQDANGAIVEVPLSRYTPDPSTFDPETHTAFGTGQITINLEELGLDYNHYVLKATSDSDGSGVASGDSIEFYYIPAKLVEVGSDENTNDPIVALTYGNDVAQVEIMPVDENGNPLLDQPIVVDIAPNSDGDYVAGTKKVTLPYTFNGLASGDYDVVITAYRKTDDHFEKLYSPHFLYPTSYTQPIAPEAPNTGGIFKKLNISKTDYTVTAMIGFVIISICALKLVHQKKKNYRKNIK